MSNIFNSPFEVSLRVLLILNEYEDLSLTSDKITITDFISVYGASFGIAKKNLHGDNIFKFSEFATRRLLIQQAIKILVIKGLIIVEFNKNGFTYTITNTGINYCNSLESDYANIFRELVHESRVYILEYSEKYLLDMINKYSINSFKKGGN